jgi:hypothetical protein
MGRIEVEADTNDWWSSQASSSDIVTVLTTAILQIAITTIFAGTYNMFLIHHACV